jgi:hypothetical protein
MLEHTKTQTQKVTTTQCFTHPSNFNPLLSGGVTQVQRLGSQSLHCGEAVSFDDMSVVESHIIIDYVVYEQQTQRQRG